MASQDDTVRARMDSIKANLRSTSTCSDATVTALQELLFKKNEDPVEKENVRVKAQTTARRRAGTATTTGDNIKQPSIALAPKQRYVLATEVANTTLKTLADALKNPSAATVARPSAQSKIAPGDTTRKPARPRPGYTQTTSVSQKALKERPASQLNNSPQKPSLRRSLSHSAVLTLGPDTGLVATAECARLAFGYLGTAEAAKVLGKDAQALQYENGLLVLIGKLVALGLDSLAVKELRLLKKRLDAYMDQDGDRKDSQSEKNALKEKETLASLLEFGTIDLANPAVPLVATLQTYALRIIAKLKKPQTIETAWNFLRLSNPSSPANLIWHTATAPNAQTKAARQLESLAQTILAMCPSISRADDANTAQPSSKTVFLLQQLAFKIRTRWWGLVKHKRDDSQELWDPFAKCAIAFARRSQLGSPEKYRLVESLYTDLAEQLSEHAARSNVLDCNSVLSKTLCSLAQSAGLSDEALRWLGSSSSSLNPEPGVKQASRLIQTAVVSMEALLKGDLKPEWPETIASALRALNGSLGGSTSDIDALFVEVNALRRVATRLLVAGMTESEKPSARSTTEQQAVAVIAASMHFSARFVGINSNADLDSKARLQHNQRMNIAWNCLKSIIDSVMTCCKQTVDFEDQWQELDGILQNCLHILYRFEEDAEQDNASGLRKRESARSCIVKVSNAYWAKHIQLKKAKLDPKCIIKAMQRSIDILNPRLEIEQDAGHLTMKLEQLGETLEDLDYSTSSRKAFGSCIRSHLSSKLIETLSQSAATCSLHKTFRVDGPLNVLARVLKAYHRSFIKFSIQDAGELAFYDDDSLSPPVRGALLEWQLGLYLRTLSRNRNFDAKLNKSVASLAEQLQEIYTPEKFPLRHLRLLIMLSRLSQEFSEIWSADLPQEPVPKTSIATSDDATLRTFEGHLRALYSLKFSMMQSTLFTSSFRADFQTWDNLISSAATWEILTDQVDDIENWLQDVQASVELLNARGEEYLALPILRLLVKALELQNAVDSSALVTALCSLGLQFLRLGYTGKAGLTFARVETVVGKQVPSTEVRLLWHISYAEYLLAIGNKAKCETTLADARSLALADPRFMDLAKPSTTLSSRMRFNRILADASYVYSLCATANGSYKEAARHAKQCVSLNRRIWAAYESRINAKKTSTDEDMGSHTDTSTQATFDPLSSMRNDKGIPLVMSVTHNALCGPQFWSLVPALYRALMQHSQIFAHQGLLQEAMYVAEQAEKVASATNSPTLMIDNVSWQADCWSQSGRTEKAETLLETIAHHSSRQCVSVAGYYAALARTHHTKGQYEEEIASYNTLEQLLTGLSSPSYIRSLEAFSPSVDSLAGQMSNLNIGSDEKSKTSIGTSGRKPRTKPTPRTVPKPTIEARPKARAIAATSATAKTTHVTTTSRTPDMPSIADQCSTLSILRVTIMDRGVLVNILQDDLAQALALLTRAETLQGSLEGDISHIWAAFKAKFAQGFKQIAEDFTVNTLPESTIAFPAIGLKERRTSDGVAPARTGIATGNLVLAKGRAKKQTKEDFVDTLCDARDRLVEAHGLCAANGSNHLFQQISVALGHVTVLLSAVSRTDLQGSVHPLYAAYMSEIPKCNALRLAQDSVEADKEALSRDKCLQWPLATSSNYILPSVSDFQRDCIDTIPETWAAVSLALNEDHDELFVTRFERGMSPFVLRLPLARHASRDVDEEEFSFEEGKRDFNEIIELSDFSTKTAKDMTSKEARHQWWTEREALDTRLRELLLNMENIWLGGFKGIFSQHDRQPSLLARFRKSFENILNQHLPSRRKKSQQKRPVLDPRVLELFIGLGDANNGGLDLDEALMDLIYFVVDILQFSGERNAYDEIDFDTMVVETHDALRAYHNSSNKSVRSAQHTILILDKNLHAFPWESLPCLEQLSISRLPSLVALRERTLAARASRVDPDAAPGHYIHIEAGGTTILNPSGDLAHTLKTIKPRLDELQGSWNHITSRAPTEKEFEDSLRENELVLYFGHGSGAQYIKSKAIRRLYSSQQEDAQPQCATTLLFGCSSVHLAENGIYEPSGMLSSYLTAGAPAVVGMLWDVTDKDCDRFAVKAGELWGLWPEQQEDMSPSKTPAKTPAKKGKGKSRVAQLVDEVECTRGSASEKKSSKGKGKAVDGLSVDQERRRGLGLDDAVKEARKSCVLRYLNGAAAVVYGIPVYLE